MLGRDHYKIQGIKELKKDDWQSLFLLYQPLIFNDALMIYAHFLNRYTDAGEISDLLAVLNMPLDNFLIGLEKLNEYRLLDTYRHKQDNKYLFVLKQPKSTENFLRDDIFSRILLNSIGNQRYNDLYSVLNPNKEDLKFYNDETKHLKYNSLINWSAEKESDFHRIKKLDGDIECEIKSYFDVKHFLNEASTTLLPYKFRTKEVLSLIGRYGDIYNISQDQMRVIVGKAVSSNQNEFNVSRFKRLCGGVHQNFNKVDKGRYDIPCSLFLMNLQEGKAPSPADMELISELIEKYYLPIDVVNALIEHALNRCGNRLIRKYIMGVAADLRRNNVANAQEAQNFLGNQNIKKGHPQDILPSYDDSHNPVYNVKEYEDLLRFIRESDQND